MKLIFHPVTPEKRLVKKMAAALDEGAVLIFPTDSGYSIGCRVDLHKSVEKLNYIRGGGKRMTMTVMAADISSASHFAEISNVAFRYMRPLVPGPYTFVLPATHEGQKLLGIKRTEVGLRIPNHIFLHTLFEIWPHVLLAATAGRDESEDVFDPEYLEEHYRGQADWIADMGKIPSVPTSVISFVTGAPVILRKGEI